jgi:hypothetical protein
MPRIAMLEVYRRRPRRKRRTLGRHRKHHKRRRHLSGGAKAARARFTRAAKACKGKGKGYRSCVARMLRRGR